MKILHYINNLGSGGAEKLLTDLLPYMKQDGHIVHLAIANKKGNIQEYKKILYEYGIEIIDLSLNLYNPLQIIKILKLIRNGKYEIVHAHLFPTEYWLAFASIFISPKTKLFKTEHSTFNNRRKYKILIHIDRWIYQRYYTVICITNLVKLNLSNWLKSKQKIEVIPNGVNIEKVRNSVNNTILENEFNKIETNVIKLLMVGSFTGSAKDQNTLIKAVGLLPDRYHLYFAGEGELLSSSQLLTKELNLENRIHFLGMRTDVYDLMNFVDLNILSTNYEGLSGVTLESLASCKPFIGSDVSGVNDIVPDYSFLFRKSNPTELANKIELVCNNRDLANQMIEKGNAHVKSFGIELMAQNYLKLYKFSLQTNR